MGVVVAEKRERRNRDMEDDGLMDGFGLCPGLFTGLKTLPDELRDRPTKGGNGESCSGQPEI